jgi:hypothetical protein
MMWHLCKYELPPTYVKMKRCFATPAIEQEAIGLSNAGCKLVKVWKTLSRMYLSLQFLTMEHSIEHA